MHTSVDLSEYIRREDACAACKEPWTEETDELDFMQLLLVMVPHSMHHFDKDTSQEGRCPDHAVAVTCAVIRCVCSRQHGINRVLPMAIWPSCIKANRLTFIGEYSNTPPVHIVKLPKSVRGIPKLTHGAARSSAKYGRLRHDNNRQEDVLCPGQENEWQGGTWN